MGQVITLASGKGGVGKSTVCGGLCASLALAGKRVLAIDCDAGLRNLDLILGLENQAVYNLSDVLTGRRKLSESMIRLGECGALFYLAAPAEPDDRMVTADNLEELFLHTGSVFDFIFLDSPSGAGRLHKQLSLASDLVLILTTPDYTSVRAAERTSQYLGAVNQRLIINRVQPTLINSGIQPDIDSIIDTVSVKLIGLVPEDPNVSLMTNTGRPVTGDALKAGVAVANIAKRLDGQNAPIYRFW